MISAQWKEQQQSSGRLVSGAGGGSGGGWVDTDLAARMQAVALVGAGLDESIPTPSSSARSSSHGNNNVAFPVEAQLSLFGGVTDMGIMSTAPPHDLSMIATYSSPSSPLLTDFLEEQDGIAEEGAPDASSLSTLSQGESKPVVVPVSSAAVSFHRPVGEVADLCKAPVAAFLMHEHDTAAYIGLKGGKVTKLRKTSGVKTISVCNDHIYEVDGKKLVLVRLRGHPLSVHKAVQITESAFEIFPAPPEAVAAVDTAKRAAPRSSKSATAKPPRSMGYNSPTSAIASPFTSAQSPFGATKSRQQSQMRFASPATTPESVNVKHSASPRQLVKVDLHASLTETEISADSESTDRSAAPQRKLREFCHAQAACLRVPPEDFVQWLISQDVQSLPDLLEAVNDDDFREEMQANGLKGFKKSAFKKSVESAVGASGSA